MLVLNEVQHLLRLRLPDKFERTNLKRCSKLIDNLMSLICPECSLKKLLRISDTTLSYVLLSQADLIELIYYGILYLRGYASRICYLKSQLLYLIFLQMLEDIS